MVHHMDKSPLVEVLGSFTINILIKKLCEKYQVLRYGNGMCVDMGMRFSMNFGHENFAGKISCNFIGTGTWMSMYSGNKFFENSGHLKFSCTENSQEMLDQYYQNYHGQKWVMSLYPVVKLTSPKYPVLLRFLPYQ